MTLDEFIQKWNGKGIDYDGAFGYQCVDLYRRYVADVLAFPQSPAVVGAADIWDKYLVDKFDRISNTPEGIPQNGDIVIWGRTYGPYGHVAICVSADVNSLSCFSQNDPTGTLSGIKTYASYRGVLGWLHPKSSNTSQDALTECLRQHTELVTKCDQLTEANDDLRYDLIDAETEYNSLDRDYHTLVESDKSFFTSLEAALGVVTKKEDSRTDRETAVMAALATMRQKCEDAESDVESIKELLGETETEKKELEFINTNLALEVEKCQNVKPLYQQVFDFCVQLYRKFRP